MSNGAVYRTAPATPGLLINYLLLSRSTLLGQNVFYKDREGGELSLTVLAVYRAGSLGHACRSGLVGGQKWTGDWGKRTSFIPNFRSLVPRELDQH